MSGINGWPSQKKITYDKKTYNEFVTVQPVYSDKNAVDTAPKSGFRLTGLKTIEAGSDEQTIIATAHGASAGDFIRFEAGATLEFFEASIVEIVDANTFRLGTKLPSVPPITDTYYILRYTTPRVDSSGSIISSSGPVQYNLDGVTVTVNQDTVVPASTLALPVKQLGPSGLDNAYNAGVTNAQTQRVVLASDMPPQKTGLSYLTSARLDYSVTNVDNATWTQLIANTGATASQEILLFDGGGYAMELGIGAAAAETRMLLIPPGGFNGNLPINIPAGSRLSVRAVGAALVNLGEIDINLLG